MSLINDALKRTQQNTQSQIPPRANELELRPIEPRAEPAHQRGGVGKAILWFVVLIVLVANAALWFAFKHRTPDAQVEARVAEPVTIEQPAAPSPPEPAPTISEPASIEPTEVIPIESPAVVLEEPATTPSTSLDVAVPVEAQAPELKLKSIVSHPTRPSAMINNRVLFVGERAGGYTIIKIDSHSVTLEGGSGNLVLTLP